MEGVLTLANERRGRGKEQELIPLFKRPVELEPNFAIAYARLGAS